MKSYSVYTLILSTLFGYAIQGLAQKPYALTVRINYSNELKVYHDEPLLFIVSVTNKEAQEGRRWNNAADRRLRELEELMSTHKISREDYDKEKKKLVAGKKQISPVTIGSPDKSWSSLITWKAIDTKSGGEIKLTLKVLPNPSTEAVAVLDEKGYYQAYFGMDPDELKKLPEGDCHVTAILDGESSEAVDLQVRKENMPAVYANSDDMLLKTGQYHWHEGDSNKTLQYAEMILKRNPVSVDGLSLKGEAQVMARSYQSALETFQEAVKQYQKQNSNNGEPPEYLLEMIGWIKTQIN